MGRSTVPLTLFGLVVHGSTAATHSQLNRLWHHGLAGVILCTADQSSQSRPLSRQYCLVIAFLINESGVANLITLVVGPARRPYDVT